MSLYLIDKPVNNLAEANGSRTDRRSLDGLSCRLQFAAVAMNTGLAGAPRTISPDGNVTAPLVRPAIPPEN
jgi:hypothetical protein